MKESRCRMLYKCTIFLRNGYIFILFAGLISAANQFVYPVLYQRYVIKNSDFYTFVKKLKYLYEEETSLSRYVKSGRTNTINNDFSIQPHTVQDKRRSVTEYVLLKLHLEDVNTNIAIRIIKPQKYTFLTVDIKSKEILPPYNGRRGGEIFRYKSSLNGIMEDIAVCKSFETNVLDKICKYKRNYHLVIFSWLGFFFIDYFVLNCFVLFMLLTLAFYTKIYYRNYLEKNDSKPL